MRTIDTHKVNGCNEAIEITVLDEPGHGGACHHYCVEAKNAAGNWAFENNIEFQNGPIAEVGVNGITHEALLAVLIDRLRGFQSGPYQCQGNAMALAHLENAMDWLQRRTQERLARGVEGTHQV